MPTLSGERVELRDFSPAHLDDPRYAGWLADPEVVKTIYRLEYLLPCPPEEIRDYASRLMRSRNDGFFAIHWREDGRFVGTLRIGHIDWRAGLGDIGILVGDRDFWGRGIATEAVALACDHSFRYLSLRKLTGGTPATNTAMCRCFERLGFRREGTLRRQLLLGGEFVDHALYGLFRDEFQGAKR